LFDTHRNLQSTHTYTAKQNQRELFITLGKWGGIFLFLICAAITPHAQTLNVRITINSLAPPRAQVEGFRADATTTWTFRDSYAGISGLDGRLENLSFTDSNDVRVSARRLAPGHYVTERAATKFSYQIKLDPPRVVSEAAHVSWLANEHGVLMLGDLLPLPLTDARVKFNLPAKWSLASAETTTAHHEFNIANAEDALFFVGQNLRERRRRANSLEFAFVTTGQWAFDDEDASEAVEEILVEHSKITGIRPRGRALIVLTPFPTNTGANMWSAETRGRTVFFLSGRLPSATAALAQLNVPLTHELFHLWVPNALAFDGEYDWFYEGFTLYQSMRVGMRLGYLSFHDYLNALGRAFDGYNAARGREEISLLEASRRRWTGATPLVYNKGMLVAFLYDLTLRTQTSGKRSLDDAYRELFRRYGATDKRRNANDAITEILSSAPGMQNLIRQHVHGASQLDAATLLTPFGLQTEPGGVRTRISVAPSLNRAQRDLLRGLGYNEGRR
jgi:hypothetical protein